MTKGGLEQELNPRTVRRARASAASDQSKADLDQLDTGNQMRRPSGHVFAQSRQSIRAHNAHAGTLVDL